VISGDRQLITTLGPISRVDLGAVLPHEHVFVDLRRWDEPGYAEADTGAVVRLMAPEIEQARAAGITAIVECSTVGVGRRADILRALSSATGFPLVVPTGVYREPWIPDWVQSANEGYLEAWMFGELDGQIESSGVQAGLIKLSAGDDGLTSVETKVLRAAARAAARTNSVIGSHTIKGRVVLEQLDIIEAAGHTADRFIWIHTQAEPDLDLHLEVARRGAWIEYDAIGSDDFADAYFVDRIRAVIDAGLRDRLLLSQDRGSYDPAQPGGGTPRPYTYLSQTFIPLLRSSGFDDATIARLTETNPFEAFAR
jgi:phosphotriesterase-related protein